MDIVLKLAKRHFNYNCRGGFSCTCPGCAGPTRTRIAEMTSRIDQDDPRNRASQRTRRGATVASDCKRILTRRAKRKAERFAMKEAGSANRFATEVE